MASEKWKHFERVVAAIHKAADQPADVRWNETINDRQFDVTIRFRRGLYEYLTVIECKDYQTAVPVDKVEAFNTKARDVKAKCVVMASTSGFQSGAQEVALRHDVTLIHVTESAELDPSVFGAKWGDEIDVLSIKTIELEYADGEKFKLREEPNAMTYYVRNIVFQNPSETCTLDAVITKLSTQLERGKLDEYKDNVIDCAPDTQVIAPDYDEIPLKKIAKVHVKTGLAKAKTLTGPTVFDPALLPSDVKVKNLATGEEITFTEGELALGINTVFEVGKFFEQPKFGNYYYCGEINGNLATMYLLESFQLGQLFQVEYWQETKYANLYIPVTDKRTIQRLQRRFDRMMAT
jgi:Restriction endonuclease